MNKSRRNYRCHKDFKRSMKKCQKVLNDVKAGKYRKRFFEEAAAEFQCAIFNAAFDIKYIYNKDRLFIAKRQLERMKKLGQAKHYI